MPLVLTASSALSSISLKPSARAARPPEKLVALSECIINGWPLRAINLSKALRNETVDRLDVSSKWMSLVTMHTNTKIQCFIGLRFRRLDVFTINGPQASTPVSPNVGAGLSRFSGRSAIIWLWLLGLYRRHLAHLLHVDLMASLIDGIQYSSFMICSINFPLACSWL